MKKILTVLLLCVMLFGMVSCKDEGVPDGMKLASNTDIVLYSLFVPEDWIIDEQSAMTMAHVSDSNKSSVSVMQWNMSQDSTTVDEWWTNYHKKELSASFPSFTVLEEGTETIVDSRPAKSYTYTITFSETVYKYYVIGVLDQGSVHVITYTSTEELYEEALTVVKDEIVANFRFN